MCLPLSVRHSLLSRHPWTLSPFCLPSSLGGAKRRPEDPEKESLIMNHTLNISTLSLPVHAHPTPLASLRLTGTFSLLASLRGERAHSTTDAAIHLTGLTSRTASSTLSSSLRTIRIHCLSWIASSDYVLLAMTLAEREA
jgi:hypothetical protein